MLKPSPGSKAKLSVCARQCTSDEGVAGPNVLEGKRVASPMHVGLMRQRRRGRLSKGEPGLARWQRKCARATPKPRGERWARCGQRPAGRGAWCREGRCSLAGAPTICCMHRASFLKAIACMQHQPPHRGVIEVGRIFSPATRGRARPVDTSRVGSVLPGEMFWLRSLVQQCRTNGSDVEQNITSIKPLEDHGMVCAMFVQ